MKKLLLVGSVMLVAVGAFGQGVIVYNNRVGGQVIAPVYGNETGNPTELRTGNTVAGPTSFPGGSQTYTGPRLSGGTWRAVLYAGPAGTADGSLTPVVGSETSFRLTPFEGFVVAPASPLAIPGVPAGSSARLQLRAFDSASGSTYETSLNRGFSLSFDSPLLASLTAPPPNMIGLTSFNVALVPEPSTIALGVLGAIFFLIRRRK